MKLKSYTIAVALLCGLALTLSPAAFAQSSACVHLLVGAGYAAEMNVVWNGGSTGWSGSFAIGQTKCQSLSGVPAGAQYTVKVYAILGKTIDCSPHPLTKTTGGNNPIYLAWGQTLNVHCEMPGTDGAAQKQAEMEKAARTPNAKGSAAGKRGDADAKKSPPPDVDQPKKQ